MNTSTASNANNEQMLQSHNRKPFFVSSYSRVE